MPVLLYCLTLASAAPVPESTGLGEVRSIEIDGLRCYFSSAEELSRQLSHPENAKKAAVAFFGVLEQLFRHVAIIPFRFPTLLTDEAAVGEHISGDATYYRAQLTRLRDMVQMEARLQVPKAIGAQPVTGAEYLRAQGAREAQIREAVAILRAAAGDLARDWGERRQRDEVRLFALVTRQDYGGFMEKARAARLPGSIESRITGPWPATEFLEPIAETRIQRAVPPAGEQP